MKLNYLIVLTILTLVACKSGSSELPPAAALRIDDTKLIENTLHIGADYVVEYIDVKTNIADWTASVSGASGDWLNAMPVHEPQMPATGIEIVQRLGLTAERNINGESRFATLTLKGKDIERIFRVEQAAAGKILTFETPRNASMLGEILDITVTANVEYGIDISSRYDWIEDITDENTSQNTHRLRIKPNPGVAPRSVDIQFQAKEFPEIKKTLVINQQGGEPAIAVDGEKTIHLPWDAKALVLNVIANVPYNISFTYQGVGAEWIWQPVDTRTVATKEGIFTLSENVGAQRTVIIHFISDNGETSAKVQADITVIQAEYYVNKEEFKVETPLNGLISLGWRGGEAKIELKTNRDISSINLGALPEWIKSEGDPERKGAFVVYTFAVIENPKPAIRSDEISFTSGTDRISVTLSQNANVSAFPQVSYSDIEELPAGEDFRKLCDNDHQTYVESGSAGGWPKVWRFVLDSPANNRFNRMMYYPLMSLTGHLGIKNYAIVAYSNTESTYYTLSEGSIPSSFYATLETMGAGYAINIPAADNVKYLLFIVKDTHGSGSTFGASEMQFIYDNTQNIGSIPNINIATPSPLTVDYKATSAAIDICANTPYDILLRNPTDGTTPDWICRTPRSETTTGRITFTLGQNEGGTRSAIIVVRSTKAGVNIEETIMVTQIASDVILRIKTPVAALYNLDAKGAGGEQEINVELTTNLLEEEISHGSLPEWITFVEKSTISESVVGFKFTVANNSDDARDNTVHFSGGGRVVELTVNQQALELAGVPAVPTRTIYYNRSMNNFDVTVVTDGDKSTHHTVAPADIWCYEFSFPDKTKLATIIYYPRNSETEHGAFRKVSVQVVARNGGVEVKPFTVEIPASVYLTEAGRRAGWHIDLAHTAENVSHVRIIPESGYQSVYSVGEIEFFSPKE